VDVGTRSSPPGRPALRREVGGHRGLVALVATYFVAFLAFGVMARRSNTVQYAIVTACLIALFTWIHVVVGLPDRLLWALALLGLFHLAGGLIPVGGDRILYNLPLRPHPLAVDRLVHAFGAAVVTLVGWQIPRPHLLPAMRTPWAALCLVGLAGMGACAIEEVAEFISSRIAPSNAGGYVNTGWDLVFDLIGCVATVVWLRRRGRADG
jgi:hypothetical protein